MPVRVGLLKLLLAAIVSISFFSNNVLAEKVVPAAKLFESGTQRFVYDYGNGNKLITEPGVGVFFDEGGKQTMLLELKKAKQDIVDIYQSEMDFGAQSPLWIDDLKSIHPKEKSTASVSYFKPGMNAVNVQIGKDVYLITKLGHLVHLPINNQSLEELSLPSGDLNKAPIKVYASHISDLESKSESFTIQSFHDVFSKDAITFLVSASGRNLYLGKLRHGFTVKVVGDILIIDDKHQYDLNTYEELDGSEPREEYAFKNHEKTIPDEHGKPATVQEIVERQFEDLGDELKDSDLTYEPIDQAEIDDLRRSFNKKENTFVIEVGEAGSGKTQLVYSFIKKVKNGEFPEIPSYTKFLNIDPTTLTGGTPNVGMFEGRVRALLEYSRNNPVVLFMDEVHNARGAGAHANNENDFFAMIKRHLSEGSVRILGTSTEEEAQSAFSGDTAISRRITYVKKKSPPPEIIVNMMIEWAQKHSYEPLSASLLNQIRELAAEYEPVGSYASRAIKLLDEVYASAPVMNKKFNDLTSKDIEVIASRVYSMNPAFFDNSRRADLLEKALQTFDEKIAGLDEVKQALADEAALLLTRTGDSTKPQGRIIFTGPKGLGKTYVPSVYAEALGLPFYRIVLSEYSGRAPEDFLREIGTQIRKNAFTVFLIDEPEKVPAQLQEALLGVLDRDHIVMTEKLNSRAGGSLNYIKVSTAHATIFLGTNAGSGILQAKAEIGFIPQQNKQELSGSALVGAMVNDGLSNLIVDRTRGVYLFKPPTSDQYSAAMKLHMTRKLKELEKISGFTMDANQQNDFLKELNSKFYGPNASYRSGIEFMDKTLSLKAARAMLKEKAEQQLSCSALFL